MKFVLFLKGKIRMADEEHGYRCEECGATFDNGVEWEQHNRKVHLRYTCETCRETLSSQQEFESHNFKMHPEQQKFPR